METGKAGASPSLATPSEGGALGEVEALEIVSGDVIGELSEHLGVEGASDSEAGLLVEVGDGAVLVGPSVRALGEGVVPQEGEFIEPMPEGGEMGA